MKSALVVLFGVLLAAGVDVPPENKKKGEMPSLATATEMTKRLLDAIVADDASAVAADFFPEAPFLALKSIEKSDEYYKNLFKSFGADVHKEHERIKGLGKLSFDGLQKGECKWKDLDSEMNKIAYWSCYGSRFYAKTEAGKRVPFRLRAMINWGKTWYVTHLLPISE